MNIQRNTIIMLSLLLTTTLFAQEKKDKWDVAETQGPHKEVSFTVTEGTWMNLDISPDGKQIVFDLLGDIYSMPITGGKAQLISGGLPYEFHPRYTPDAEHIIFTSDRGGGDNIWIINTDGSDARAITKEKYRLTNGAECTPDGEYVIAHKHFTSQRSLGAGELWMYHISGGSGIQLTTRKNDQMDAANDICISADGNKIYFSEDMSSGKSFQYNKDPNGQIYMVRCYDRETGKVSNITGGSGGACRPQLSPDGKLLAFVRRVRFQSVLYMHDLETGEEWPVYDKLSRDQQETWAIHGVYPTFAWMPDGKEIVLWAKGKIRKLNVETTKAEIIPFEAEVNQTIQDALNFKQEPFSENFKAKMIRDAVTSPDGKWLAFNAVGHIYIKSLPDGKPQRLTEDAHFEFYPSFSPDGKSLAYAIWDDASKGAIYVASLAGLPDKISEIAKITPEKGYYHRPQWSPDSRKVVYRKSGGSMQLGMAYAKNTGLYIHDLKNKSTDLLLDHGSRPQFSASGESIYYLVRMGGLKKFFRKINISDKKISTIFSSKYSTQFTPSPDGKWLAFTELFQAYVTPFPQAGKSFDLSKSSKAIPLKKVSRDAGTSLHWAGDSKTLHWVLGPEYYSRKTSESFNFVEGAPDSLPAIDITGLDIGLSIQSDIPKGTVLLANARIISMNGDEVIENGYIMIEDNRIVKVKSGAAPTLKRGHTIDCTGKTIIPGLIDVHAHFGPWGSGLSPQQHWGYMAHLAYGVTTTHDPSVSTEMVFSQHEMVEAGEMVGPRIFSTGRILYGAEGDFRAVVNSLDDARSHLRRLKAVGAFSVKSYNQPRREQRQQVIAAARELKMMVVPEGGSTFLHNMSMILDGHTGIEHSIPVNPFYADVTQLWNNSQTAYTPTLIVGYGGIWGENYWYDKTDVWKNEKLLKFTPRAVIDARSRRRTKAPDEEYAHIRNAEGCKKLNAGTKVNLGAHGQLQGLGAHWELWMLEQGGMSSLEALRCATQNGADYLGMGDDLGSIEKGKLADLIILNANPLENIQNTEKIAWVIKNGQVYDPNTLDEVGNRERKRQPFFWENSRSSEFFPWHGTTYGFHAPTCGCSH